MVEEKTEKLIKPDFRILKSGTVEFMLTEEILEQQTERAKNRLLNINGTIERHMNSKTYNTKEDPVMNNLVGIMGEFISSIYFPNIVLQDEKKHDFINPKTNKKIEIKTKAQSFDKDPRLATTQKGELYEASISEYNKDYQLDDGGYYVFCRVCKSRETKTLTKAWLIGYMDRDEYIGHEKTRFISGGTVDGSNKTIISRNSYNLAYKYLKTVPKRKPTYV